jgi:phage terminase small subunit
LTKLTPQQQRFVIEYARDFNATQAALRAGYSPKTAGQIGYENLNKPQIQAALSAHVSAAMAQANAIRQEAVMEKAEVLARASAVARASVGSILYVTPDGDPYLDLSKAGPDELYALTDVTVEDFIVGRGDDAREVRRVRVKMADKLKALELLARHHGLLVEKVEVTVEDGMVGWLKAARLRTIEEARRRLTEEPRSFQDHPPAQIINATARPLGQQGDDGGEQ